jgi:uncharacterized repeat protein (TIGR03803 family)
MRSFALFILGSLLCTACASRMPLPAMPSVQSQARSADSKFRVLHRFQGGPNDGSNPEGPLIDVGGTLYGTTQNGGKFYHGTVYRITRNGRETVIYSFGAHAGDGASPAAGLLYYRGTLFGTTMEGGIGANKRGEGGLGTVFSVTPSGREAVLHAFGKGEDGLSPSHALIEYRGVLYGATADGGKYYLTHCCGLAFGGTVFAIAANGSNYHVLYNFGKDDGGPVSPSAKLCVFGGILYGTSAATSSDGQPSGNGSVFTMTTSGKLKSIRLLSDSPNGGLAAVGANLYGLTQGYVYRFTPAGKATVIYTFAGRASGADARGELANIGNKFYGSANQGGTFEHGLVFSVTAAGKEQVLYSGFDRTIGVPLSGVIASSGVLYGTAINIDGDSRAKFGTLFSVTP